MRISNLIKSLQHIQENEGDLNVYLEVEEYWKPINSVRPKLNDDKIKICNIR